MNETLKALVARLRLRATVLRQRNRAGDVGENLKAEALDEVADCVEETLTEE